jgi:hypothetical protein
MSESITVLRCASNLRLAKLVTPTEIIPFGDTKTYDAWTFPVADLEALGALLDRLQAAPRCCVVRGELINGPRGRGIRRTLYVDTRTGEQPTLRDVPRRWVALDMEGVDRPDGVDASDVARCARVAIARLPEAFHGAGCVAQATAGHGIKPGIRLRLWHWLSRPTDGGELRRWLKGTPADPSIFGAAQPIFTAGPAFAEGMADHLPARLVAIAGKHVVDVPSVQALAPPPRPEPKPLPEPSSLAGSRYALAALRGAAARVATAPTDSRHPTCLAQSMSLARLVNAGLLARSDVEAAMTAAMEAAGKTQEEGAKIVAWALDHPSTKPLPEGIR